LEGYGCRLLSTWGLKVKNRELSWTERFREICMKTYVYLGLKGEEERTVLDRTARRDMDADLCLPGA
jgi:hypothetical protein